MKLLSKFSPWSSAAVAHDDGDQPWHDDKDLRQWLDDTMGRWLAGLPWVVERPPFRDQPVLRCFAIDCEPLGLRRVWALVGPLSFDTDVVCRTHVVLPNWLADHAQSSGGGAIALSLGDSHALVTLRSEPGPDALERLHSLLLMAYASAFS
jgi:hypothetical protein